MAVSSILPTHWYYNTESGQLTQGNNLLNLGNNLVGGAGWHELNIPGNATVQQAAAEARKEFPNGKPPTNAGLSPQRVINEAGSLAGSAAATAFGDVLAAIPWIRIVKVLAGSALLLLGLAKLTGADKTIAVAGKAVAKAPLL